MLQNIGPNDCLSTIINDKERQLSIVLKENHQPNQQTTTHWG